MNITRRQFLKRACSIGGIGLVAGYPIFVERYLVQTNFYRIPVPNLPKAFAGLRIVQLSDLHYGLLMPDELLKLVVDRANRLNPDIIVCTGDYVQGRSTTSEIDRAWQMLSLLAAPSGVFSVLGNHDHWAGTARSDHWLRKTGQDLRHKVVVLRRDGQSLWLAGAGDLYEDHRNLDHVLKQIPDRECRIVLAHNPDTADTGFSGRVDLMISGHTHGGQVRIPFVGAPLLPVENKSYTSGLKRSRRGDAVFISRGIGWAICPVRFNCFPEIAVLELVPVHA